MVRGEGRVWCVASESRASERASERPRASERARARESESEREGERERGRERKRERGAVASESRASERASERARARERERERERERRCVAGEPRACAALTLALSLNAVDASDAPCEPCDVSPYTSVVAMTAPASVKRIVFPDHSRNCRRTTAPESRPHTREHTDTHMPHVPFACVCVRCGVPRAVHARGGVCGGVRGGAWRRRARRAS
eukprot:7382953-Prymnesium_polylepis.1